MAGKFVLKKSGNKFMWNLLASNGKVVLTSQRYATKKAAEGGIVSVKKNCGKDSNFERKTAKNGKTHFNILAANKQVVGSSQMYASPSGCAGGMRSVKANAPKAKIDDQA